VADRLFAEDPLAIESMESTPTTPQLRVYQAPRFRLPFSARPRYEEERVATDRQLPLQLYREPRPKAEARPRRRVANVAVGVAALIVLLPVLVTTAVVLRLTKSGPIIDRPIELRPNGRGFFRAYRFRIGGNGLADLPKLLNVVVGDIELL
jgi:hypothetical protein